MCAGSKFSLLKYPKLTPLYQCQFIPNSNCKISPFKISKGFDYIIPSNKELDRFVPPAGFSSDLIELKALCFSIKEKLKDSVWKVVELKQHSFQELYIFENEKGNKIKVRFTYDKNIKIKSVSFPDENIDLDLCKDLKSLLSTSPILHVPRLAVAMKAIEELYSLTDYNVLTVNERSEWELLVGLTNGIESIELKFYVAKGGLVTKVMPERASSQNVIDFIKGTLNE
jgi:hypothetical protein